MWGRSYHTVGVSPAQEPNALGSISPASVLNQNPPGLIPKTLFLCKHDDSNKEMRPL